MQSCQVGTKMSFSECQTGPSVSYCLPTSTPEEFRGTHCGRARRHAAVCMRVQTPTFLTTNRDRMSYSAQGRRPRQSSPCVEKRGARPRAPSEHLHRGSDRQTARLSARHCKCPNAGTCLGCRGLMPPSATKREAGQQTQPHAKYVPTPSKTQGPHIRPRL
jgi:hypothetical protein